MRLSPPEACGILPWRLKGSRIGAAMTVVAGDRRVKTLLHTEEGAALRMRLLDRLSEPPPGPGLLDH
jgi:hypothetical protein